MKQIRERKHRLADELYKGFNSISFTVCVKDKITFFNSLEKFLAFEKILLNELESFKCDSDVYLFMPDHFHLIVSGKSSDSDIKACLEMFKQKSGFHIKKLYPGFQWQKDYYDHIIKEEENLVTQIKYILNNSVRAGITSNWKDYRYKGSTRFNFDEWD